MQHVALSCGCSQWRCHSAEAFRGTPKPDRLHNPCTIPGFPECRKWSGEVWCEDPIIELGEDSGLSREQRRYSRHHWIWPM
jgi:hypothetical protein